ncbi:Putative 6-pyruvoyl tetrahydropterin synthase [Elusimicrobium minutum Pei191]|uniref:6-carboxy-5,6,7,8-tetrahydropterin synthase n=1 Tax=Elusimicrobium minutum (strain Pei191) TaxID=445932 RepID=B2KC64_ELUMP|nr:6-carboxytetrahydropterin synthase [Elusimicrobium minutum]ACC98191.1 Putative 6-pyruvoyl tetrahydropterin synthase [Elusimicrobium minutum Pei191]
MLLKLKRKFSSAHRLPDYDGECNNLHGHTWVVEFIIEGETKESGMVEDFKTLKPLLDSVLPDHKYLNDFVQNPTAENMVKYIYDNAAKLLTQRGLKLKQVELWENENASAIFQAY